MRNSKLGNLITSMLAIFMLIVICGFSGSCKNEQRQQDQQQMDPETAIDTSLYAEPRAYQGEISSLNQEFNDGNEVSGTVAMRIERGIMRINVFVEGVEPEMMHMQHLQASEEEETECPSPDSDENNDGIIDVMEITDDPEGVKLIPLNMGPSSLVVDVSTYPKANINGEIQFETYVHLDSLRTAVREEYGIENVDFTKFTYIIQGVSPNAAIPVSTVTIGNIYPYVTVPVGCAVLEEVNVDE